MKVNKGYYVYFGFINSMMALVTGIIMGLFVAQVSQWIVMQTYKEPDNVPIIIQMFIGISFPLTILAFLLAAQFIIGSSFWGKRRGAFEYSFNKKLAEGNNPFTELGRRLKEIKKDLKNYGDHEANTKFKELINIYPDNMVVQFQYAIFCENNGKGKEAIDAYEKALSLVPESEIVLNTYVADQIRRVKTEGPSKCDVIPGSKYILY
jgi:hypothetical protein